MNDTWRKPKTDLEGNSLVLDIIDHLEGTEEDSLEREITLRKAFRFATYCPFGITHQQRDGLLDILYAYGEESIYPVLDESVSCPTIEVHSLAKHWIANYHQQPQAEDDRLTQINTIKTKFGKLVNNTVEQENSMGRSVLVWQKQKLLWKHGDGTVAEFKQEPEMTVIELTEAQKKGLTIKGELPSCKGLTVIPLTPEQRKALNVGNSPLFRSDDTPSAPLLTKKMVLDILWWIVLFAVVGVFLYAMGHK